MTTYQYIGKEYTMIRLEQGAEKVKVSQWEFIDTDIDEQQMLKNGFQVSSTKATKTEKKVENKKIK